MALSKRRRVRERKKGNPGRVEGKDERERRWGGEEEGEVECHTTRGGERGTSRENRLMAQQVTNVVMCCSACNGW